MSETVDEVWWHFLVLIGLAAPDALRQEMSEEVASRVGRSVGDDTAATVVCISPDSTSSEVEFAVTYLIQMGRRRAPGAQLRCLIGADSDHVAFNTRALWALTAAGIPAIELGDSAAVGLAGVSEEDLSAGAESVASEVLSAMGGPAEPTATSVSTADVLDMASEAPSQSLAMQASIAPEMPESVTEFLTADTPAPDSQSTQDIQQVEPPDMGAIQPILSPAHVEPTQSSGAVRAHNTRFRTLDHAVSATQHIATRVEVETSWWERAVTLPRRRRKLASTKRMLGLDAYDRVAAECASGVDLLFVALLRGEQVDRSFFRQQEQVLTLLAGYLRDDVRERLWSIVDLGDEVKVDLLLSKPEPLGHFRTARVAWNLDVAEAVGKLRPRVEGDQLALERRGVPVVGVRVLLFDPRETAPTQRDIDAVCHQGWSLDTLVWVTRTEVKGLASRAGGLVVGVPWSSDVAREVADALEVTVKDVAE